MGRISFLEFQIIDEALKEAIQYILIDTFKFKILKAKSKN